MLGSKELTILRWVLESLEPGQARMSLVGQLSVVSTLMSVSGAAPTLCPVAECVLVGNGCSLGPGGVIPTSHPSWAHSVQMPGKRARCQDTHSPKPGESLCAPDPQPQPQSLTTKLFWGLPLCPSPEPRVAHHLHPGSSWC